MSEQKLSAFEKEALARLSAKAALSAVILDAWANAPRSSSQNVRSLVEMAQLVPTEENGARAVLSICLELGLAQGNEREVTPMLGHDKAFRRLAFALYAVDHHVTRVHRDLTIASVVLTTPPEPSILERKLSDRGWRTSDLEATQKAFQSMISEAKRRVVVMTPFLDVKGAMWLKELLQTARSGVERTLILRSLEAPGRSDYPDGYDLLREWLASQHIHVMNYSIPWEAGGRRETFHAKVILCDTEAAYLGSSNMTAASIEHSMEMGVVIRGKAARDVATIVESVLEASKRWI